MLAAFVELAVGANRLQQVTDAFLPTIMEKRILAQDILEPVLPGDLQAAPDPSIFSGMQMPADGEKIPAVEKLLQFSMPIEALLAAQQSTHRLYRQQAIDIAVEKLLQRNIGVILALSVSVTE